MAYPPQPYPPSPLPVYPIYSEPVPGPPQMVHQKRLGFLFTGLGIAGGMAIVAPFGSTRQNCAEKSGVYRSDCEVHQERFWIPVVGPLLATSAKSDPSGGDWLFAALWAAAQTTGLVFIAVGLIGHDVPVRRPLPPLTLNIIPTATPHSTGLTLRLTF